MNDNEAIIDSNRHGHALTTDELLPLVYHELRRLAAQKMANERSAHTLQPTALVHEAYLRLLGTSKLGWKNRSHFVAAAAEAMRRILIDRARRRKRIRHGGKYKRVDLHKIDVAIPSDSDSLLLVHEALDALASEDSVKAELVKLRFFAGVKVCEAGELLGLSSSTTHRYWTYARAWIYDYLTQHTK